jgi:site-specific DNA-adenine methylase
VQHVFLGNLGLAVILELVIDIMHHVFIIRIQGEKDLANLLFSVELFRESVIYDPPDDFQQTGIAIQLVNGGFQRAARFMFLITRSFGSKGDSFGTSQKRGTSSMYNRLERIKELHRRLDMVIIENLSYEKVIEKYDTKSNFFYCDPPYMLGYTYENSKQFSHEDLCAKLKKIKGRFILSYDDNPEVLKLYKGFDIKHVTRTKGINRKVGKSEFNEVIIANFPLEDQ